MVKKTIYFDVMLKSSDRINLNDFKARQKVMTNDKNSVDIVFRATDVEPNDLNGATASIFLYMQDGSFFQSNSVVITNNILTYTMTQNQTQHKGTTKVQIVVKSGTIDNASLLQEFEISPGLEKYPLTEVMIQDWTTLTAEAKAFVDQIEGFTLESFVENKMGEELANLEVNYAGRLTGLESKDAQLTAQLAHIHYDVINEGAVGDGITDDTLAIQSVLDKIRAGESIYFPEGKYRTTSSIVVTKPIEIKMLGAIVADHSEQAIILKDNTPNGSFHPNYHSRYKFTTVFKIDRLHGKGYELSEDAVGVEMWNVFSGKFYFDEMNNHNVSIRLIGDNYGSGYAGTSYCIFTLGVLNGHKKNIEMIALNNGYVTQNQFYSGSVTGHGASFNETIHVDMINEGTSVINENSFFGLSFEGGFKKAIKGHRAHNNRFISCRYEMPGLTHLFDFENALGNELLFSTYVSDHMAKNLFNDNGVIINYRTNTKVVYYDYRYGSIEYYDRIFYIKPNKNIGGRGDATVNSVSLNIPKEWEVRVLTQGLSYNRLLSNENNTVDRKTSVSIQLSDYINVAELSENPFDEIVFIDPPNFSKEIFIRVSVSGDKPIKLSKGSMINQIIDKTGTGLESPYGRTFIKMFYDYLENRIYVLEYI